mmetsp:Transcript_24473/g.68697  ORF Transcript_24473/g.68697 Transcript_24473/m.68697 type:complete len:221 (+) Transcript_24473:1174-1836(+)
MELEYVRYLLKDGVWDIRDSPIVNDPPATIFGGLAEFGVQLVSIQKDVVGIVEDLSESHALIIRLDPQGHVGTVIVVGEQIEVAFSKLRIFRPCSEHLICAQRRRYCAREAMARQFQCGSECARQIGIRRAWLIQRTVQGWSALEVKSCAEVVVFVVECDLRQVCNFEIGLFLVSVGPIVLHPTLIPSFCGCDELTMEVGSVRSIANSVVHHNFRQGGSK